MSNLYKKTIALTLLFTFSVNAIRFSDFLDDAHIYFRDNISRDYKSKLAALTLIGGSAYIMSKTVRKAVDSTCKNAKSWISDKFSQPKRKRTLAILGGVGATALGTWLAYKSYQKWGREPIRIVPQVIAAVSAAGGAVAAAQPGQTCNLCFEGNDRMQYVRLECGHSSCTDCLNGMLNTALDGDHNTRNLLCPTLGCREPLTENDIRSINHRRVVEFSDLKTREAVDADQTFKHCPNRQCNHTYQAPADVCPQRYRCPDCRYTYCPICLRTHNGNMTCAQAREQLVNQDEQQYNNWVRQHAKPCPQCRRPIEKNDGCNHMTCRDNRGGGCGHEFCWVCLRDYRLPGGGVHMCNAFGL